MVNELIGHLKPSEERINHNGGNTIASLNLIEDELMARLSSCLKVSGNSTADRSKESLSSNNKCGRGCGRGHGPDGHDRIHGGGNTGGRGGENAGGCDGGNTSHDGGGTDGDVASDECCYYGKRGHWARECRKMKRDEEVHATQAVEDHEPTLFMVSVAVVEPVAMQAHPVVMHLDEGCLFAQLREKGGGDCACWILDSGATNHMTSMCYVFSKVDHRVHGTVHFGDGRVTNIEGRSTILIKCKTGGYKALTGVYYIPRPTVNIICLGLLEEASYKILLHGGFLKLLDRVGALVAKVKHGTKWLYILYMNINQLVC
jgi:hypothetical protein